MSLADEDHYENQSVQDNDLPNTNIPQEMPATAEQTPLVAAQGLSNQLSLPEVLVADKDHYETKV